MFYHHKDNIHYKVINIISGETHTFNGDLLYPDDTNNIVIKKIIHYCYPKEIISINEIYAYSGNESICFDYDDIDINQIITSNKITDVSPDTNFVDEMNNRISVKRHDKYNELFENNNISDNTIYYFSLKELLFDKFNIDLTNNITNIDLDSKTDNNFKKIYLGLIRKYFPNFKERDILYYPAYQKSSQKDYDNIHELIENNHKIFNLLNKINDDKFLLEESDNIFKLMKLSYKSDNINSVNITKLFADFPLSGKYFLSKLILEDYEDTYYKLYKDSLKLELSSDDKLITKKLCKSFIKDYKEYIPLNIGYVPSFIKYENVFFLKIHITTEKDEDIFFSFILHLNGNIDLIINNYNNITITEKCIMKIIDESNNVINRINNNRIYSDEDINELIINDNLHLEYFNMDLDYSMENFINNKNKPIYKHNDIKNFITNFYTHFRILKERMDLEEGNDIYIHYKRVSNYENMGVIDSIISLLKHPKYNYSNDQIIEVIRENNGISFEDAQTIYTQWEEKNSITDDKGYRYSSKEPGSDIIISRQTNNRIKIQILNITSFSELSRITKLFQFIMFQYKNYISDKIDKTYSDLFKKINTYTKKISFIENKIEKPSYIKPKAIYEDSESDSGSEIVSSDDDDPLPEPSVDLSQKQESSSSLEGDSSGGGGSSESEIMNISNYFTHKLDKHDPDLFRGRHRLCQASANKQVTALYDDELEKVKKNDILNYLLHKKTITIDDKRDSSKHSSAELLKKYKLKTDQFQSYSEPIKQKKSSDKSVNINYICPKYWDISKDLPIHPRDIHKYVDDIIPPKVKKGKSDKHILNRTGPQFKYLNDEIFKKNIIKIIDSNGIKVDDKISELDWDKFQEFIDKLDLSDKILDLIDDVYKNIVRVVGPNWMDSKNNVGDKRIPCCKKRKPTLIKSSPDEVYTEQFSVSKSVIKDINISKLSLCNKGRYCHVHPKLQRMFNHDDNIKNDNLGGFVINGVTQDNNSLIHTLISLDEDYKNKINKLKINKDIIKYIKQSLSLEQIDKETIDKNINVIKTNNILTNQQILINNPYYYIKTVLISHIESNPYFIMMNIGDGNILQLFKSDKYTENDIKYFLCMINYDQTKEFLKNVYLDTYVDDIINHFKDISLNDYDYSKMKLKKLCNPRYLKKHAVLINDFTTRLNSFKKHSPRIVVMIYNLIISSRNYIDYLSSNEIKDYKYIIPLITNINKQHNKHVFIFENIDDSINLCLQLFKYDKRNKVNFIYKKNNMYEPIVYINKNKPNNHISNLNIDLGINTNVDNYIKFIIDGIYNNIDILYSSKNPDEILTYEDITKDKDINDYEFFVDNYCKISHIVDNDKIHPILPTSIKDNIKLIYVFPEKLPSIDDIDYITYEKKGIIVNNENKITDIVYKNNTYLPLNEQPYKKGKDKYLILGDISIRNVDDYLQTDSECNDIANKFNTNYNFMKYFTQLIIQVIIYHIKNSVDTSVYYTYDNGYFVDDIHPFIITPTKHNGQYLNFVNINNHFFDQDEPQKFTGVIKSINKTADVPDAHKLNIQFNYSNIINIIINNPVLLNYDKQVKLHQIIIDIIDKEKIFKFLKKSEYDEIIEKIINDINIYTDRTYSNQCIYDNNTNDLIINKDSEIVKSFETIKQKVVWNLVELLIINKNIDSVNNILQNNIDRGDLYKSEKDGEIFFNYIDIIRKDKHTREYIKLNEIFKYKSTFIREINFYDFNNDISVLLNKSQPLEMALDKIPNIIKSLFGQKTIVITYLDATKNDYLVFKRGLKSCEPNIEYGPIGEYLKKYKDTVTDILIKLKEISETPLFNENNIGILLITNHESNKLKHTLELFYNDPKPSTKFILLYNLYNPDTDTDEDTDTDSYNLTNIMINNDKNYMTLEKLYYNNHKIKKIINADYPDIHNMFNKLSVKKPLPKPDLLPKPVPKTVSIPKPVPVPKTVSIPKPVPEPVKEPVKKTANKTISKKKTKNKKVLTDAQCLDFIKNHREGKDKDNGIYVDCMLQLYKDKMVVGKKVKLTRNRIGEIVKNIEGNERSLCMKIIENAKPRDKIIAGNDKPCKNIPESKFLDIVHIIDDFE